MALMNRQKYADLQFGRLAMLDELMMGRWNQNPPMFSQLFNVRSSSRAYEELTQISGFGLFTTKAEGDGVEYDTIYQGFNKRHTHLTFAKGFQVSMELADDDLDGLIAKAGPELARAGSTSVEYYAWDVLNNGFSTGSGDATQKSPDNVTLFGAHTAFGPEQTAISNETNVDLAVGTLETGLNAFANMVDDRGMLIAIQARKLVVPNEGRWLATEILKSQMRSDTTDNATNAFNQVGLDIMVVPYITDPDAWFLFSDKQDHRLLFYWRMAPTTDGAVDFDSGNIKNKLTFRCVAGAGDYRGAYGSRGA